MYLTVGMENYHLLSKIQPEVDSTAAGVALDVSSFELVLIIDKRSRVPLRITLKGLPGVKGRIVISVTATLDIPTDLP